MELETRVTRQLQTLCIVLHVIESRSCGPQDPPPESGVVVLVGMRGKVAVHKTLLPNLGFLC